MLEGLYRYALISSFGWDRSFVNQQIFLQHVLGKFLQHCLELFGFGGKSGVGVDANVLAAVLIGIVRYRNDEGLVIIACALRHA